MKVFKFIFSTMFLLIFITSLSYSSSNSILNTNDKIFFYRNGDEAVVVDNRDCVDYYVENDNGDFIFIYTTCN